MGLVEAGIDGGFTNTSELNVMNYQESMANADAENQKAEMRWRDLQLQGLYSCAKE